MVHMVKPNVSFFKLVPSVFESKVFIAALNVEGEMLSLTKITRSEMGAYLCIGKVIIFLKKFL